MPILLFITKYELIMGTGDSGSAGDAVCQVNGCLLNIKWHATVKTTNRPISLCEKHGTEYNQNGLIREMVSV
jgi:hypothetical protein